MAKVSITFAAWKEGRVAPGTGHARILEPDKNARARGAQPAPAVPGTPQRSAVANNLKQIGVAFHNYLSAHGTFPASAIYGKDGKPLLSWRVALLPYLEKGNLYREFKLDEPWDSPHNLKLLDKMPKVYAPVAGDAKEYWTFYRVFTGPGTICEGAKGTRI